jgi:hypothetical protein
MKELKFSGNRFGGNAANLPLEFFFPFYESIYGVFSIFEEYFGELTLPNLQPAQS